MKKLALAVFGSAFILSSVGLAQSTRYTSPYTSNQADPATDYFRVNYFSNIQGGAAYVPVNSGTGLGSQNGNAGNIMTVTGATTPDEFVDIVNPGTNGAAPNSAFTGVGDLCALIYVVDTQEELQECCGCLVTPDQLIELSVQRDLDSNPLLGRVIHSGTIKIISSAVTGTATGPTEYDNSRCDPSAPVPTPTLREWITHTRVITSGGTLTPTTTVGVTEVPFADALLSTTGASEEGFLATTCGSIRSQGTGAGRCNCPTTYTANNAGFSR